MTGNKWIGKGREDWTGETYSGKDRVRKEKRKERWEWRLKDDGNDVVWRKNDQ